MTPGPILTGSSIVALKYKYGIMIAADMKASYGSYGKFQNVERILKINNKNVMAFSGEIADAQYLHGILCRANRKNISEKEDKYDIHDTKYYHSYLTKLFYNRKNKINPFYNTIVVAGINSQDYDDNDKDVLLYTQKLNDEEYKVIYKNDLYIGFIDMHGTSFNEDYITTGYGRYFALTLLRNYYVDYLEEADARKLLLDCLNVLYSRDCTASNKIQIVKITTKGIEFEKPFYIKPDWNFRDFVYPSTLLPYYACFW